ncbi:hypothetical protein ACQKQD_34010, partial [Methylobacterium sp. NPDC080182]
MPDVTVPLLKQSGDPGYDSARDHAAASLHPKILDGRESPAESPRVGGGLAGLGLRLVHGAPHHELCATLAEQGVTTSTSGLSRFFARHRITRK